MPTHQKSSDEIKEEVLSHIGLSKANRDFYQKLYGRGNRLAQPVIDQKNSNKNSKFTLTEGDYIGQ